MSNARLGNITEIGNIILKTGTIRRTAKRLMCAQSVLFDQVKGSWVYFFALEDRIKIGFTSNLVSRLQSFRLHTGGAGKFNLITPGLIQDETEIHNMFKEYQIVNEWYIAASDIFNYAKRKNNDD